MTSRHPTNASLSVTNKLWLLGCIPVLIEVVFAVSQWHLIQGADLAAARTYKFYSVSNAINGMVRDVCKIKLATTGSSQIEARQMASTLERMSHELSDTKYLLADDRAYDTALNSVGAGIADAKELLNKYEECYLQNNGKIPPAFKADMDARELTALNKIVALITLAKERHQEIPAQTNDEQAITLKLQQNLVLFLIASAAAILSLTVYVTKSLTRRITALTDNAIHVAAKLPMGPALDGGDELAAIDVAWRRATETIAHKIKTERLLIAYAADLICTIDEAGLITEANPASQTILNGAPAEMIGKHWLTFINASDIPNMMDAIEKTRALSEAVSLPVRIKTGAGPDKAAIWSMRWSASEKSMFCTIHDDSERVAAQRQKEQLIAMITHDLRSPLMTIEHVTEMFLDGELGRITKETALAQDAQESAGDMMASINKILKAGKDQADVMR